MKLILDREDLLELHRDCNCSQTTFEMFKPEVQEAIRKVGRAKFIEYGGNNYNAIYPPADGNSHVRK